MTVSVLMISYNHEKYIREAMQSILMQQTDFPFEIVICDDSSTDRTDEIISEIRDEHSGNPVIKYFRHEKNIGMMQNIFFTLRHCTGKYIAVCEGDDYWTDAQKLQKQVDILEESPQYAMAITNRKVLYEDGTEVEELYERDYKKSTFTISDVVSGFMPGTQTILFRNFSSLPDFFVAHPEFYYADRYIVYFCSLFGSIILLPQITAVYRMTGEGVWSVNTSLEKLNRYTKFMNDFHQSLGIPSNQILNKFNFNAARATLRYCIKRPKLLMQKSHRAMIKGPWKELRNMDKIKLLVTLFKK